MLFSSSFDNSYLQGQLFPWLDSSPLLAIRPDSPAWHLDCGCACVCVRQSVPWPFGALGISVYLFMCCVRGEHICNSVRHFIAHFNARPPKSLPSALSGVGAWRRAANPPLLCLLFARQLIIEPASPCTAQQSIINPFSQWFPAARSKQGFNLWCLVSLLYRWGCIRPSNTANVANSISAPNYEFHG